MNASSPYVRTFSVGAGVYTAVICKAVARHPGGWSAYPTRNLAVFVVAWILTALLLGLVASRFPSWRSWLAIIVGTGIGSFAVMGMMLVVVKTIYGPPAMPKFKDTDETMVYMANEATKWVQQDRRVRLDYSLESIRTVEEELARISGEVDKTNPQRGTFGLALGYGAYIGEVFRRREGGAWTADHAVAGSNSYPLTITSQRVIFPVGWCWKRLTIGEEDNVYLKALAFTNAGSAITNSGVLR